MANTHSLTVQNIWYETGPDSEEHSNVVYAIDWLLTASDNENPVHEALWSGVTRVTWEEDDDWIVYEDLTESDVMGWVEDGFAEGALDEMKSKLDAQIEEVVNPTKLSSGQGNMPWDDDGA